METPSYTKIVAKLAGLHSGETSGKCDQICESFGWVKHRVSVTKFVNLCPQGWSTSLSNMGVFINASTVTCKVFKESGAQWLNYNTNIKKIDPNVN